MSVNTSAPDLSWLSGPVAYLLEVLGVGGLGLAWRGSARLTRLEETAAQLRKRADAHDSDRAAVRDALTGIRENVARLPTRAELEDLRADLKQDFRASRRD